VKEKQSERRNMLVKYFEEDAIVPCTCSTGDGRDAHDHLPMCQSAMLVDCTCTFRVQWICRGCTNNLLKNSNISSIHLSHHVFS